MKKIDFMAYLILAFALGIGIYTMYSLAGNSAKTNFQTLTSDENDVEFQVTPLSASEFQVAINTQSVELDFDLTQISALYDDIGNAYKPLKWEGSAPGGHHRSGILRFPKINANARSVKLIIKDSTRREFNWNIR